MENLEITLKMSVNEVNIVLAGLGKLPLESVVTLWQSLKAQAESQIAVAEPLAAEPPMVS